MSEAHQRQIEKNGIMRFRGQDYAVGLLWLASDEEDDAKVLKNRAKSLGADFYVVRDTVVQQNGFGFLEQGHRRGLPAGASTAADVLVGEWHGVFKADNGWWYVAVHSDAVAPDGDILFDDEEAAYQYFISAADNYRWPRCFVPDSWDVKDSSGEISLDKVFDDIPDASLQPANLDALFGGKRNKDVALILVGLVFGVLFLTSVASQILPSLLPQPRQAPQMQVSTADVLKPPPRAEQANSVNPVIQFGTFTLPVPSFVVIECLQAMEMIVHPLPMWNLDSTRCDGRLATALWRSQGGDLDSIRPYISKFGRNVTHTYDGSGTFTATKFVDSLSNYMQQIVPLPRDQAILLVNDRFGDVGTLTVQYKVPGETSSRQRRLSRVERRQREVSSILQTDDNDENPPFLQIELQTRTPATKIGEYFNIPGLSLQMIEYDIGNQMWTYTANVILRTANQTTAN